MQRLSTCTVHGVTRNQTGKTGRQCRVLAGRQIAADDRRFAESE